MKIQFNAGYRALLSIYERILTVGHGEQVAHRLQWVGCWQMRFPIADVDFNAVWRATADQEESLANFPRMVWLTLKAVIYFLIQLKLSEVLSLDASH